MPGRYRIKCPNGCIDTLKPVATVLLAQRLCPCCGGTTVMSFTPMIGVTDGEGETEEEGESTETEEGGG